MENDCSPCGSDLEPTSQAWKALNKTLKTIDLAALSSPNDGLNWKLDGNLKQLQIGPALVAHLQRIVSPLGYEPATVASRWVTSVTTRAVSAWNREAKVYDRRRII
jgi:alpha-beta hydrolase superfamily lysophospholipase